MFLYINFLHYYSIHYFSLSISVNMPYKEILPLPPHPHSVIISAEGLLGVLSTLKLDVNHINIIVNFQ